MKNRIRSGVRIVAYLSSGRYYETLISANDEGTHYLENPGSRRITDVMEHVWLDKKDDVITIHLDEALRFKNPDYADRDSRILRLNESFVLTGERLKALFYVTPETGRTTNYSKYYFRTDCTVTIGRGDDNDIVYPFSQTSLHHAALAYDGDQLMLMDNKSRNGTYLNGKMVENAVLKTGDRIHIGGMDILVGAGFIGINLSGSQASQIRINSEKMGRLSFSMVAPGTVNPKRKPQDFFSRYPRRRLGIPEKRIQVDSPPYSMEGNQLPLLLRMGSSLVMGGTSAMMGNYTMLLSTVLFPFLTSKYNEKEKKEYEQMRVERYSAYLKKKSEEILQEIFREEKILNTNYPPIQEVLAYADKPNKLWSRKITDDDFLKIRMGSGEQKMEAEVVYQKKDFTVAADELEKQMLTLVDHEIVLDNIPVMVDLQESRVTSIIGNSKMSGQFLENMVWRMAMLYSYDELKIMFVMDKQLLSRMDYIRYLPHVWTDDYSERFIATTSGEAYQISDYLSREMETREQLRKSNQDLPPRHYLIIAQNKKLFDEIQALKTILKEEEPFVSVMTFFPDLPKESRVYIRVHTDKRNKITYLEDLNREAQYFDGEYADRAKALHQVKKLPGILLKTVQESNSLPSSIGFLELFKARTIEDLHIRQRWTESNPIKSLAAPIGVGADGSLFTLDLHQKFQGPHGLVAGTTGSGKSEFLITYILSLALNYHPDEAAFVLIDYKGGGLAGAFSNPDKGIFLPHVIGTITNLDGSTIQRAITSIEAELERRQRVFNEAKNLSDEGTMDIYQYQQLYRSGTVKEPIPHLFIISDEFAELKQKEPAFLEKLVSAARIGRSLGVHLILATQKPSGVVNDQILSNTKFRVCLKVQDRADSTDMLKRPDAAELKEPGRFYLQVGFNEYFALGQSAWCGAPYNPQSSALDKETVIKFVDLTGNVIRHAKKARKDKGTSYPSQLVSIVSAISDIARQENLHPRQLWEPPLPSVIDLDSPERLAEQSKRSSHEIWFGNADDPKRQRQFPLWIDLSKKGNAWIVGQARTGKSTLLQSMLLQLAEQNTPDQANFYIMDFSGNALKRFAALPHCGQLIGEADIDSMGKFFELLDDLMEQRKKELEELDASDYFNACLVREIPYLYVIIDGLSVMKSTKKGESLFFNLPDYLKACPRLGMQFIITSSNVADLTLKYKNEMGLRMTCVLKEKYEYEEALAAKTQTVIPDLPGRGMYVVSGEPLEIQMPCFAPDLKGSERNQALEKRIEQICEKYSGYEQAKGFPRLPKGETYEQFQKRFEPGRIPLGYEVETAKAVALPLLQFSMMSLYFGGERAYPRITEAMLRRFAQENAEIHIYKAASSCVSDDLVYELNELSENPVHIYDGTLEGLTSLWKTLATDLESRLDLHAAYCEKMGYERFSAEKDRSKRYMMQKTHPICVWLEGFNEMTTLADEAAKMTLDLLFTRGPYWNMYFIGSFFPDSISGLSKYPMFTKFNPDNLVLAVGGQFVKQKLVTVSREFVALKKDEIPDFGVMRYRGSVHNLLIPCGEFEALKPDPDELSIF